MEIVLLSLTLVCSFFALLFAILAFFKKGKGKEETKDDRYFAMLKEQAIAQKELLESRLSRIENAQRLFENTARNSLDSVRTDMQRLTTETKENLKEIRGVVDEKLTKTLDERLGKSFESVTSQLKDVYTAMGEMSKMSDDVFALRKVLTNVKTKGILGETQLGNILADILAPDQYDRNVSTKRGSREQVEFAIRLPGKEDGPVYIPVDSKFPLSSYERLKEAEERADKEQAEAERKLLKNQILSCAKDIAEKYIDVPRTTDFAVLFLPIESLYEEVLSLGLLEPLQNQYHVVLAGPSTMCAFLNALSVGFQSVAIERKSSEVYRLLGKVRQEFDKFQAVLTKALANLDSTKDKLEELVGVRTRRIQSSLRSIAVEEDDSAPRLGDDVEVK